MRIIPVFDIMGGRQVQAVGGQREGYQPLESPLLPPGTAPADFCRVLKGWGFTTFYAADLDSIMGTGDNFGVLEEMAAVPGTELWVDIGLSDPSQCRILPRLEGVRWVLASETIPSLAVACELQVALGGREGTIFSIDLKGGEILSPSPEIRELGPVGLAELLFPRGFREYLVLELARVGTGAGPDLELMARLCRGVPGADFYPGGGVRNVEDLKALEETGAAGALVATALYHGAIPAVAPDRQRSEREGEEEG